MKCKKCGKEIKNKSKFCKFCGTPAASATAVKKKAAKTAGKKASSGRPGASLNGIIIIAVVCAAIAAMFFITQSGSNKISFSGFKMPAFGTCGSYPKDLGSVQGADVQEISLNAALERLYDIAVTQDGSKLFIMDAEKGMISEFNMTGETTYKLKNSFILKDRPKETLQAQPCYFALDEKGKRIFAVDCGNGTLSEYDWNGVFKKRLAMSDRLYGTRSIRYQDYGGGTLITSVPPSNSVILYNTNGVIIKEYALKSGNQCDNFQQPCYAGIDSNNRLFVVDSGNKATKIFKLPEMKFEKAVLNEGCSTIMGPQVIFADNAKVPYFAITSQNANSVLFVSKDGAKSRTVKFNSEGINAFHTPSAMASDSTGNVYVISPALKKVMLIKLNAAIF